MRRLPKAKYSLAKHSTNKFVFGGINHSEGARDGDIYDCENISMDEYPSVSARGGRELIKYIREEGFGMGSGDELFYCAKAEGETYFYYNHERQFPVEESEKTFAVINKYICIFPDKMYYSLWDRESKGTYSTLTELHEAAMEDETVKEGDIYIVGDTPPCKIYQCQFNPTKKFEYITDVYGNIEKSFHVVNTNNNYTRKLEDAEGRRSIIEIRKSRLPKDLDWMRAEDYFKITIVNKEAEIKVYYAKYIKKSGAHWDSKETARFYFDYDFGTDGIAEITIERVIPDLSFAFCHDNRIWGIDGNKICASKLGDPFNFQDFSLIADSSWQVAVASSGEFTGGIVYNGYPTFFKEDSIIRVGGNYPSQYSTYETKDTMGVMEGAHKSLSIVNGRLFYLSPSGVCAYTGSYPYSVGEALGEKLSEGVGGALGDKYYLSAKLSDGSDVLYKYDTKIGAWVKESAGRIINFASLGKNLFFMEENGIYIIDGECSDEEVESFIELAPIYDASLEEKGVSGINLSCKIEEGAYLSLFVSYDGGEFTKVWESFGERKRTIFNVPLIIRRCNTYRLRFEGIGKYVIYGIGRERYYGK